jgi:membrane protease YdiL (CAAX protease family)
MPAAREPDSNERRLFLRRAMLALLLLVPVPSLGTYMAMVAVPGRTGQVIFALCKLWILLMPVVWWLVVEKGRLSWSPVRRGGMIVGTGLGALVGGIIAAAYIGIGVPFIDPEVLQLTFKEVGLSDPRVYLGAAAYWIVFNSLVEEYVYRWFVFMQCERLMPGWTAVLASALVFTLHHIVALQVYLPPALTALASFGVFVGGATWSWCYLRYRSIWPGWISHIVADIAIFSIGWHLVFA